MDDAVTGESDGGARSARGVLPLAFLTLSAFLLNTSEFIPVGLLSDIADAFSLSESGAGLMITIYAWAVAALSLPLMIAASRLAPRRLILAVLAVFAVGQLASACAPSFPALVAARVLVAAAHAVFWSVASPLAVRVVEPERSSTAMGCIVTGSSIAMILGLPIGRALGLAFGWRMAFACMAAAALVAVAGLAATFPRLAAGRPFTLARLPELVGNRALTGLYLATILFSAGYYVAYSYVEPFLAQVAGMSPDAITAALTVFGVAGLVGSWLFARLFDAHRTAFLCATTVGLAASLLALGPTAPVVLGPLAAGPLAVCVVWGLCATAFNVAAQAEVIHVTDQDASAVAMSIFSGLFNVGVGAGSVIGGMVCDGPGIALVGVVGGVVAGAGALWSVTGLARRLATVDR